MLGHLKLDQPNKVSSNPTSTVQGAYLRANGRMRVLLTRITRTPPFVQGEAALSWL
jgi:hypothetical protein